MSCAYFTEFASFANFSATARGFINKLAYFAVRRTRHRFVRPRLFAAMLLFRQTIAKARRQAAAGESGDNGTHRVGIPAEILHPTRAARVRTPLCSAGDWSWTFAVTQDELI
jgi:hypothetical protein